MADHVLEHGPDVRRADEHGLGPSERLAPPVGQLGVSTHRVFELGTVCLHREGRAAARSDRRSQEDVIREDQIRRQLVTHGRDVQIDVPRPLGGGEVLEQPRLEAFVPVEDEDGEQSPDVRPDDTGARQVVALRTGFLAEDDDVVPRAAPLPRQRARVDVGPGAVEQIPVPEQDPHPRLRAQVK